MPIDVSPLPWWSIAQAFHREGAELAFTYPNDQIEKRVRPLAASLGLFVPKTGRRSPIRGLPRATPWPSPTGTND